VGSAFFAWIIIGIIRVSPLMMMKIQEREKREREREKRESVTNFCN
jgi:hypothetical protein